MRWRWRPRSGSFLDRAWQILDETIAKWLADDAFTQAAALSYYAAFSIAPLMIIAIAFASFFVGTHGAESGIMAQLQQIMGARGAHLVKTIVTGAQQAESHSVGATLLGIGIILFGASGVFLQLHKSLNHIWGVPPARLSGILAMLRQRFLSFAMVMAVGLLLLLSLVVSAALATANHYMAGQLPFWWLFGLFAEQVTSVAIFTLLFALIFKILPEVEIDWKHVWIGAGVSAVLFAIGKTVIGIYLSRSNVASMFGAAGSLAVLLLWIFYGALILLLGAQFTFVYAGREKSRKSGKD